MNQPEITERLRAEWVNDTLALSASKEQAMETFSKLQRRYSRANRHYHDFRHIEECLRLANKHCSNHPEYRAIRFALWFHDSIYQTWRGSNENRSAILAGQELSKIGVGLPELRRVTQLIRLTAGHHPDPADSAACYMADIDLAILGAEPTRYREFEMGVRKEYGWLPELIYRRGRLKMLRSFAERDSIFHTASIKAGLEKQARSNLAQALQELATIH